MGCVIRNGVQERRQVSQHDRAAAVDTLSLGPKAGSDGKA
jgi:hypothetical protein